MLLLALAYGACCLPPPARAEPPRKTTALAHPAAPGAGSTYEQRQQWLLDVFKDFPVFHPNPKIGLLQAMAKLASNDGNAPDALDYASRAMDFRYPGDLPEAYKEIFTYPPLARFLYMYGDRLGPEQARHLKAALLFRAHDLLAHGTENHAIMHIASAYLFGQYYPNETWTEDKKTYTSGEMMLAAKNLLLTRGRGFYHAASTEMLSPTYSVVNIDPLLNLCEFAQDPEVRDAASALAVYHLTQLALNDFDGHLLPPFTRQNNTQARMRAKDAPIDERDVADAQSVAWLLWGQNEVTADDFLQSRDAPFAILFALSHWRVPDLINRLATGEGTPYAIRGVTPVRAMTWGQWGVFKPDWIYRRAWRDRLFAIGGGALRFKPDGYYLDNNLFQIVWSSRHRFNYLECSQPYWRSNRGEEEWAEGVTTPFQQMGVGRHSAIVLFDIPERDPWAGVGETRWTSERDQHNNALLQVAQCRFPKSVDEIVHDDPWYFLREGEVFVGIRPLSDAEFVDPPPASLPDFDEIKCRTGKTGFVFEVGTKGTHASFDAFKAKLRANPVQIDIAHLDVSYTDSESEVLRVKYSALTAASADGWYDTVPRVWQNGQETLFADAPVIDSAPVKLQDGVLKVTLGGDELGIDWSGTLPKLNLTGHPARHASVEPAKATLARTF